MSKLSFQARFTLLNAETRDDAWAIQIGFSDGEGYFRGQDLQVGDVLIVDTAAVEVGTFTFYDIIEIGSISWTGEINLVVRYRDDNDNDVPNPPLETLIGNEGAVTRPTSERRLLPLPSPSSQGLPDKFSFYTLNHSLQGPLDSESGSGEASQLKTSGWLRVRSGRARLDGKPLGDFVLNMALAAMVDGSIVEILGVKPEFNTTDEHWYVRIPDSDVEELDGQIGAVMVTYLTPTNLT